MKPELISLIKNEIARAEAIIQSDNGKQKKHKPTIENYKGQLLAFKKIQAWADIEESRIRAPITITSEKRLTLSWPWICSFATVLFVVLFV